MSERLFNVPFLCPVTRCAPAWPRASRASSVPGDLTQDLKLTPRGALGARELTNVAQSPLVVLDDELIHPRAETTVPCMPIVSSRMSGPSLDWVRNPCPIGPHPMSGQALPALPPKCLRYRASEAPKPTQCEVAIERDLPGATSRSGSCTSP